MQEGQLSKSCQFRWNSNKHFLCSCNHGINLKGQEDIDKDGIGDKCDDDIDNDGVKDIQETGKCSSKKARKIRKYYQPCFTEELAMCSEVYCKKKLCSCKHHCFFLDIFYIANSTVLFFRFSVFPFLGKKFCQVMPSWFFNFKLMFRYNFRSHAKQAHNASKSQYANNAI